ncbi:uncharacterized protein C5orf52 homolog isoform X1 [Malaclemys terrapin pileata]|uniref:uncharacterized protein C5orf52 homolog isoform X1 n=1 Tax=Malaclemys terrapin pileata TaxID=2991368 RepID=UPI0023A8F6AE|nr:uncharacterized protein C5orf52 homolog isoform X1 [Malaclemys terrapin pileata]
MEEQKVSRPRVTFFQPRVNQVLVLFSLFNGSEVAVKRFLPKSHLSTVIIRDNTSVQRIQEIKFLMPLCRWENGQPVAEIKRSSSHLEPLPGDRSLTVSCGVRANGNLLSRKLLYFRKTPITSHNSLRGLKGLRQAHGSPVRGRGLSPGPPQANITNSLHRQQSLKPSFSS